MKRSILVAAAFIAAAATTVGCNKGAETAVSNSKDVKMRKGIRSYPKSVDEVPAQYRHMIIDGKAKTAPTAAQVKPIAPK